jgi:hypothetical protein
LVAIKVQSGSDQKRHSILTVCLVVLGVATAILFTVLVMISSFLTTLLLRPFDPHTPTEGYSIIWGYGYGGNFAIDFVRAMLNVLNDQEAAVSSAGAADHQPPSILRRFVVRFLVGLPLVSAASLVQLFYSPIFAPLQGLARYRGRRRNRDNNDFVTLFLIGLVLYGAARYALCAQTLVYAHSMISGHSSRFTSGRAN